MAKTVPKRWGKEDIFVNNDLYCGKFLHFKQWQPCSLHMHREKTETFYVLRGMFQINLVDMVEESFEEIDLHEGQTLDIKPYLYHQIFGFSGDDVLLEVSTHDDPEDSYRWSDLENPDIIRNKEFAKQCVRMITSPVNIKELFLDKYDYNAAELEELAADCGLNKEDKK